MFGRLVSAASLTQVAPTPLKDMPTINGSLRNDKNISSCSFAKMLMSICRPVRGNGTPRAHTRSKGETADCTASKASQFVVHPFELVLFVFGDIASSVPEGTLCVATCMIFGGHRCPPRTSVVYRFLKDGASEGNQLKLQRARIAGNAPGSTYMKNPNNNQGHTQFLSTSPHTF